MFDIRYHIASLVGIFLALSVGILLGTVIQEKGIIEDRQQALVQRLEDDFASLRKQNQDTDKKLQTSQRFTVEVLPYLLDKKLYGKNYALVSLGELDKEARRAVLTTMVQAGATVRSVSTFFPAGSDIDGSFGELRKTQTTSLAQKSKEYRQAIMNTAVRQMLAGQKTTLLDKMNTAGLAESTGDFRWKVNGVILFVSKYYGNKSEAGQLMAQSLRALKLPVAGIELSESPPTTSNFCRQYGFSSVDGVDSAAGQVSLISILRGSKGNFGIKAEDTQLLPSLSPY